MCSVQKQYGLCFLSFTPDDTSHMTYIALILNENDELPPPPSLAATISALNVVRQYLLIRRDDNDKEIEQLQVIEDKLKFERLTNVWQTQITQFFQPL